MHSREWGEPTWSSPSSQVEADNYCCSFLSFESSYLARSEHASVQRLKLMNLLHAGRCSAGGVPTTVSSRLGGFHHWWRCNENTVASCRLSARLLTSLLPFDLSLVTSTPTQQETSSVSLKCAKNNFYAYTSSPSRSCLVTTLMLNSSIDFITWTKNGPDALGSLVQLV